MFSFITKPRNHQSLVILHRWPSWAWLLDLSDFTTAPQHQEPAGGGRGQLEGGCAVWTPSPSLHPSPRVSDLGKEDSACLQLSLPPLFLGCSLVSYHSLPTQCHIKGSSLINDFSVMLTSQKDPQEHCSQPGLLPMFLLPA